MRFSQRELSSHAQMTWSELLDQLGAGFPAAIDADVRARLRNKPLPNVSACKHVWSALEIATRAERLQWSVTEDGNVRIGPPE